MITSADVEEVKLVENTLRAVHWCLSYASEYIQRRKESDPEYTRDIFDGSHFRRLTETTVAWDGATPQPARQYFAEETDVPLGISTDGVPLYKRSRLDAWPVLLTNYDLPPE